MYLIIDNNYEDRAVCDDFKNQNNNLLIKNGIVLAGSAYLSEGRSLKPNEYEYFGKVEDCTIQTVNEKIWKVLYGT